MSYLALDDELPALKVLTNAIEQARPGYEIRAFSDPRAALAELTEKGFAPEAAFLDISMYGMTGLQLARLIREKSPQTKIVFVTGYAQHALEAYSMHARGYLLKPVTADMVREELDALGEPPPRRAGARLQVSCFGNFEAFVDGKPVEFQRSKSKELFAYLVDRRSAGCTIAELSAALWEDRPYDRSLQKQTQTVISSLMRTLREYGVSNVVRKSWGSMAVVPELLDCDYYRFLAHDVDAINAYTGEYMSNYSWAELTAGSLADMK